MVAAARRVCPREQADASHAGKHPRERLLAPRPPRTNPQNGAVGIAHARSGREFARGSPRCTPSSTPWRWPGFRPPRIGDDLATQPRRRDDDDDIQPDADTSALRGIQPFRPRVRARAHAHRECYPQRQPRDDSGSGRAIASSCAARRRPTKEPNIHEVQTTETKPIETKPIETEPIETETIETETIETETIEAETIETETIETKPAETETMDDDVPFAVDLLPLSDDLPGFSVAEALPELDAGTLRVVSCVAAAALLRPIIRHLSLRRDVQRGPSSPRRFSVLFSAFFSAFFVDPEPPVVATMRGAYVAYPAALTKFLIAAEAFRARVFGAPLAADIDVELADVAVERVSVHAAGVVTLEGIGYLALALACVSLAGAGFAAATAEEGRWVKSAARAFDAVDTVAHAWTRRSDAKTGRANGLAGGGWRLRGRWFESSASLGVETPPKGRRGSAEEARAVDTPAEQGNVLRERRKGTVYLFESVSVRGAASGLLGSDPRRRRL